MTNVDAGMRDARDSSAQDTPAPRDVTDVPVDTGVPACPGADRCTGEGTTRSCFSGPAHTRNVGMCREGTQSCVGGHWTPCVGEVLPAATESCADPSDMQRDHNCNGVLAEGCACTPGTSRPCFDGPAALIGTGICVAGTQQCEGSGELGLWSHTCVGQVAPPCDYTTRMLDPIPHGHVETVASVLNDRLFVIGGTEGSLSNGCNCVGNGLTTVDVLDPAAPSGSQWSTAGSMNLPRAAYPAAVTVGCHIYVFGGLAHDSTFQRVMERYNPGTDTWEVLPASANVPDVLSTGGWFGVTATAVGDTIYAISHHNGAVAAFDTNSLTWHTGLSSRPSAYHCPYDPAVTLQLDERFVVVMLGCGHPTDGGPGLILEYDVAADVWTDRGPMPDGSMQAEHVVVANGSRITSFGSDWNPWGDRIVVYDGVSHVGAVAPTHLSAGRSDAVGGMINGRVYLAGGIVPGTVNSLVPAFEITGTL